MANRKDNIIWVVLTLLFITIIGAVFLALGLNGDLPPINNSTQFENCKVYTIDDRRAILNCTDAKLLCEVTD